MTVLWGSALAIVVLGSACTVDEAPPRTSERAATQAIIAGEASEPSEFRATGMVVVLDRARCTGTLIAPDVVLTAGHCLDKPKYGDFGFTLDSDATDGIDNIVHASVYHQHPSFDDGAEEFIDLSVRNDIGVLLLDEPILGVTPEQIEQPEDEVRVEPGVELSLCGYGRLVWHTPVLPIKRDAQVFIDRSESNEFLTTAVDPQPCSGDSGGPLFAETPNGRRLVGVVSRAFGRSLMCDTGAIITRIKPYDDWIYLASHDHNTGGCSAGGGGAALPMCLAGLLALRRRRRAAR